MCKYRWQKFAAWVITLCFWDKLGKKPFDIVFLHLPSDWSSNCSSCTVLAALCFRTHTLLHVPSYFPPILPSMMPTYLTNVLSACWIYIPFCLGCWLDQKDFVWQPLGVCAVFPHKKPLPSVQVVLCFCCQAWAEWCRAELLQPLLSTDAVLSFSWLALIPVRSLYQMQNLDKVN